MMTEQAPLLHFPCRFPIKAMGRNGDGFADLVTEIVGRHAEIPTGERITKNASAGGKYLSVTVTINALSRAQLDRIYQDLTDCRQVLVAL